MSHERPPGRAEREEVAPPALRPRYGLVPAGGDAGQRLADARPDLARVAGQPGHLLALRQIEVRQVEIAGVLAEHLDAGQRVEIELEPGDRMVLDRNPPGLVVHD